MIDRNINVFFDVILLKKENLKSVFWGVQLSIPVSQMRHCMGLGGVIPMVESRGKVPKAPTILRYLSLKKANSGLFCTRRVTHNKQIATSKDVMKDCQLEKL